MSVRRVFVVLSAFFLARSAACAADVTLSFRAVAGATALEIPTPAPLRVGANDLTLTRVAALVSSVAFVRPDGSFAQLEAQFGAPDLGVAGRSAFTVRGVPPGRYIGLQFLLGLPAPLNHADPATWPAGHPLNPLVNGLHWNWQGGYIFLALEGRYRRADGALGGWSLHFARDERLATIELPHPFEITGDATLAIEFDLARALDGIAFAPDADSTHSRPGDALADRLGQNLPAAFRLIALAPAPATSAPSSSSVEMGPRSFGAGTPLPFSVPPAFPQVALPADNPLTVEGVALGEKLFHDPRLSGDGTQACATCHAPARAFGDRVALSLGIDGLPGERNAMPLFNLAWSPDYAWDGSQPRIRDQALAAMRNPVEMHADPARVAALLAADASLPAAFAAAFGDAAVTPDRLGRALEQYLLTLVSADSKFDRAQRGEAVLTEQEKEGFALFATEFDPARGQRGADCFHCHGGALFTDYQIKHNGLDLASADPGRARVTGTAADGGRFKTPSLRNVAVTAPYMHDGRFATLEEVVAHYDHGVRRADNLDPNLAKHPDAGLALTPADQAALMAFLRTLTDAHFAP